MVIRQLLARVLACGAGVSNGAVDCAGELTAGRLFVNESGMGISTVVPEKMNVAVDV